MYILCSLCRFGPLIRHWTMRFEAKHNYFKKLASRLGNFININYSLAMRHQQLQCYQHLESDSLGNEVELGPGEMISADGIEHIDTHVLSGTVFRYICS